MASILAFLASPLGQILIKYVPDLVGKIIAQAHESGAVTPKDWLDYINSQKTWDDIPPAK